MTIKYALLLQRVKASVVDAILMIALMYGFSELFSMFENVPNYFRIAALVFIFFLYEPLFLSIYGGTIGHSYFNITVRREKDPSKYLLFHIAILRFIFKVQLGWASLFFVPTNSKRKAIHDYVASSIVLENPSQKE